MDEAVGFLDRLAPIDLRARDHEDAVSAVDRQRRTRPARGTDVSLYHLGNNPDAHGWIVEALRKRGIDVQYIVKENEGHGFQNEENRFEFYEAMESFLARHVKPARTKPVL